LPDAADIGTGWSTTCDSNSRWVLHTMRCVDSDANPAAIGMNCYGAPSRYQFRIYVDPVDDPIVSCDPTPAPEQTVINYSSTYISSIRTNSGSTTMTDYNPSNGGFLSTGIQTAIITNTPDA